MDEWLKIAEDGRKKNGIDDMSGVAHNILGKNNDAMAQFIKSLPLDVYLKTYF